MNLLENIENLLKEIEDLSKSVKSKEELMKESDEEELLDSVYISLTLKFCESKLKGDLTEDMLYEANELKKLYEKL